MSFWWSFAVLSKSAEQRFLSSVWRIDRGLGGLEGSIDESGLHQPSLCHEQDASGYMAEGSHPERCWSMHEQADVHDNLRLC